MSRHASKIKWISYAVIALSVLVLIRALLLGEGVKALQSWVESLGVWGPVAFGLIYIVAVVAMVPASLLTLAAGATFGLLIGTVTVSIASNIGAALALLIARYLARSRVEKFAADRPKFAAVDEAIDEGGWKVVALLRLSPAIPFNVQNYLYGLTSVGFWTCVLTSWVAMLPGTFLYVYLGYTAGSITGGGGDKSMGQWALLGVGLLATIAVTIYITKLAQKKLAEQTTVSDAKADESDEATQSKDTTDSNDSQYPSTTATIVPAAFAIVLASLACVSVANPDFIMQSLGRLLSLGPPAVTMEEEYEQRAGGPTFDHSTFDALLQRYVDDDGWVDYDGLQQDEPQLDVYIDSLGEAPFEDLGRNQKLALLINAYNAFTLKLVLDHWPLKSIKEIPAAERWAAARWQVGQHTWSLEQIEHEQIRPNFKEPRIHFALVCAAVGCPPLANEAYTADQLDAQLQRQAEYVHTHQTWLTLDERQDVVSLTPLYRWYTGDFQQAADSIINYAARFNPDLKQMIEKSGEPMVRFLTYDWSLNSRENAQPR